MTNQEKNCLWDELTNEQVALGARIQPWDSLQYCEDKLTDEQIEYWRRKQNDRSSDG